MTWHVAPASHVTLQVDEFSQVMSQLEPASQCNVAVALFSVSQLHLPAQASVHEHELEQT